jgi:hypothetical protein
MLTLHTPTDVGPQLMSFKTSHLRIIVIRRFQIREKTLAFPCIPPIRNQIFALEEKAPAGRQTGRLSQPASSTASAFGKCAGK